MLTLFLHPGESLPPLPPAGEQAPAPAVEARPVQLPQVLAVNTPKADVMAEVVRRVMGK